MTPYTAIPQPHDEADTATPRLIVRAQGNSGFLFVNNYARKQAMPAKVNFQVEVKLASSQISISETPITIPSGRYFIWPLNFDLGAGTLRSSTAQLLTRV
jgi:hypothetical protein